MLWNHPLWFRVASFFADQEQGATSSEEVFENLEDLAEDLGLSEEQVPETKSLGAARSLSRL